MALARYQFTVTDDDGNVIPAATVTVRTEAAGNGLANLFSDRAGAVGIANPFAADADGFAAFHVAGGAYWIEAASGAFTRTWRYVGIGLGCETDRLVSDFFDDAGNLTVPGNIDLVGNLTIAEYIDITEISAPSAPAANTARLYAHDDGAGVTELSLKDNANSIVALSHFLQSGTGAVTRTQHAKLRDEIHVADFGAVGDGSTNDTAAIQAAINYAESIGGGIVYFDAKIYSCTDLVNDGNNVFLKGVATGNLFGASSSQSGTVLKARNGATILLTIGAASAALAALSGAQLQDMVIDGNAFATHGLRVKMITNSIFRNLTLVGATTAQLHTVCETGFAGLNYVYQCLFEAIWVNAGTGSAKGMIIAGEPAGSGGNRTVFCTFKQIHVTYKNGTGIEIADADNNIFINVGCSRNSGGTAVAIDFVGDDADAQDLSHANHFYGVHAGAGGIRSRGAKAINSVIFGFGTEDSAPDPSVSAGSILSWIKDNGELSFPSLLSEDGAGTVFENRLQIVGSIATGGSVQLNSFGNDTNIDLRLSGKGTGPVLVPTSQVFVGHTAAVAGAVGGGTARFGIHALTGQAQGGSYTRWTADASAPPITLSKSRGTAVGTHTIIQSADVLGILRFAGSDGTQFISGAEVSAVVDGTPGTNDMPTALVFSTTADGASTSTERMRINNAGMPIWQPGSTTPATLGTNGQITMTLTSNTNLRFSARGSDGTTRVANLTLA